MKTYAVINTPIGPVSAIYTDELPASLTTKDAQRNGQLVKAVPLAEGDTRTLSELDQEFRPAWTEGTR